MSFFSKTSLRDLQQEWASGSDFDVDCRPGRRWVRRFVNSDLGILVTGRQPHHLLHRSQVPGACGDYDGVCTMAPQDGGAQAWGKIEPTFRCMVSRTPHGRCKTDQGRLDTPHHLTCAGCGPRIYDFVAGGWIHSALDHGAGVAPLPPPAHHKPFTSYGTRPRTHRAPPSRPELPHTLAPRVLRRQARGSFCGRGCSSSTAQGPHISS